MAEHLLLASPKPPELMLQEQTPLEYLEPVRRVEFRWSNSEPEHLEEVVDRQTVEPSRVAMEKGLVPEPQLQPEPNLEPCLAGKESRQSKRMVQHTLGKLHSRQEQHR
jgi:hypothetical protein